MSMSKKDYEMVASILNDVARTHDMSDQQAFGQAVINLTARFALDNPRFQGSKFMEAVYVGIPPSTSGGGSAPICSLCHRPRRATTFCKVTQDGHHQ